MTCKATIPVDMEVEAHFLAKEDGIIAGIALAEMVFSEVDPTLEVLYIKVLGFEYIIFMSKGKGKMGMLLFLRVCFNIRWNGLERMVIKFIKACNLAKYMVN